MTSTVTMRAALLLCVVSQVTAIHVAQLSKKYVNIQHCLHGRMAFSCKEQLSDRQISLAALNQGPMHLRGGQGDLGKTISEYFPLLDLLFDGVFVVVMYYVSTKSKFNDHFASSSF
jgi:hypothetical protein